MSLLNFKNPYVHFKVTVITHITLLNSISKTSYKMYSLSCPMEGIILLNLIFYSYEAVLKIYCNFLKHKRTFCEPAKTTATYHIQCFCQIAKYQLFDQVVPWEFSSSLHPTCTKIPEFCFLQHAETTVCW